MASSEFAKTSLGLKKIENGGTASLVPPAVPTLLHGATTFEKSKMLGKGQFVLAGKSDKSSVLPTTVGPRV